MTVLILEDERLASEKLARMLQEAEPRTAIVAQIASVAEAVQWLQSHPHPDLILSDIQLLDGLCFDIFRQVRVDKPVIFTTAYDQYAIQAFEVNSIGYLLKPVKPENLKASLQKWQSLTTASAADYSEVLKYLKTAQREYKSRFMVRLGQKIVALTVDKIAYFFSEQKLTYIVTTDNKRFPMDQPLDEIMDVLDPRIFFRINRQYIITFTSIAEIHPYFKGRVKLMLQPQATEDVIISAERTPEFKRWIDQ